MRAVRVYRATTLAVGLSIIAMQPAHAAGNLTLPFAIPNPRVTSWMDHHYPNRLEDGLMVRFDGATGYAYDGHRGTDYAVASNTPVVAADDGTIIYSEWSDSGGPGLGAKSPSRRAAHLPHHHPFAFAFPPVLPCHRLPPPGTTREST